MSGLDASAVPRLPRGVRLREDPDRGWLLLAPERVLTLEGPAAAILQEVDGERSVAEIAERLATAFGAPLDRVSNDVAAFLGQLAEKRMVEATPLDGAS